MEQRAPRWTWPEVLGCTTVVATLLAGIVAAFHGRDVTAAGGLVLLIVLPGLTAAAGYVLGGRALVMLPATVAFMTGLLEANV